MVFVSVELDTVELNVNQEFVQMTALEMEFALHKCHASANKDLLDLIALY